MPLDTEVDLGPGRIVLDGAQLPRGKGHSTPSFRSMSIVSKRSPGPSQILLSFRFMFYLFIYTPFRKLHYRSDPSKDFMAQTTRTHVRVCLLDVSLILMSI